MLNNSFLNKNYLNGLVIGACYNYAKMYFLRLDIKGSFVPLKT